MIENKHKLSNVVLPLPWKKKILSTVQRKNANKYALGGNYLARKLDLRHVQNKCWSRSCYLTLETNAEKYLPNFMDFFIENYRLRFLDKELTLIMLVVF